MDNRGHGNSGGQSWLTESVEQEADDHFSFHRQVIKELYKDKIPPTYLLSHSYGGMMAMNGCISSCFYWMRYLIIIPINAIPIFLIIHEYIKIQMY